jgi:integrase
MARNKLTDRAIKSFTDPGRYSDGGNLYLRVRETGSKSFVAMVPKNGKRIEVTIGLYGQKGGEFTLSAARARNDEIQAAAQQGIDPRLTENPVLPVSIPEQPAVPEFGVFALQLLKQIENEFRNLKHRAQWRSTLSTYCKPFWKKSIDEVNTDDVIKVLEPVWSVRNETASRVRGRIERVLDAAKVKGFRSGENPARWKGHLDVLLPKRKKLQRGHHNAVPYADIPALWEEISDRTSVSLLALKFLILTASRSGEVRGALFEEFDLEKAIWIVPAKRMKAAREHRVPLVKEAVAIIEHMKDIQMSEFVFPGGRSGRPLTDMALLNSIKDQYPGATVHGLRSSFRDWVSEETDFAREIAEAALAHTVGDQTERTYRRGDALEKRRKLMEAWAAYVVAPQKTSDEEINSEKI